MKNYRSIPVIFGRENGIKMSLKLSVCPGGVPSFTGQNRRFTLFNDYDYVLLE